jgi:hypothetical protein
MMITRSMSAPRRIDTEWEQTVQMERRPMRTRDHPYRRRERQNNGTHLTDWIVLGMFLGTCAYLWWPQ